MALRVLFAGGGTGGHVFPAIAIADEIGKKEPGAYILFVGTRRGVESRAVPRAGYPIEMISAIGLQRKVSLKAFKFLFTLLLSLLETARIVLRFRPSLVVGTGGYVSGPVVLMASLLGVPAVIQEQNSFPGITTRLLARFALQVHLTFPRSARYFKRKDRLIISGNPTREDLGTVTKEEARDRFGLERCKKTVLVFGGSQGAHSINMALLGALDRLSETKDLQIIWQTGERDYDEVRQKAASSPLKVVVYDFIDDMAAALGAADIAVTRSGATTLAELTRCGLPAILIPYPFAVAGHQEKNARALEEAGAAQVILDKNLNGEILLRVLLGLLKDENRLEEMSRKSVSLGKPDAAQRIVDAIQQVGLLE